jgi:ribonuclease VapC
MSTVFVDASAIVAILTGERERQRLAGRLDEAHSASTSPLAVFEAVAAIVRKEKIPVARATGLVLDFLRRAEIEVLSIDADVGGAALIAFERYGKGRGHKAQLNLCDCFAYAMAKQHGVPLLYKGDDFSQTDLA